jgi:hypothetical protein
MTPSTAGAALREQRECRVSSTTVPELLPQPGGSKGRGSLLVGIELQPRRKAIVIHGPHGPEVGIDLDAASRSAPAGLVAHEHLVSVDGELECLDLLLLEGVWLHPPAQRVRAMKRGLAHGARHHDRGMDDLGRRVVVAAVERLIEAPQSGGDLLVSLAHRPRSISRAGTFVGMGVGAAIALGAAAGLALGILVSVTTDVPLAPEIGLALGALLGWLWRRM